MNLIFLSIYYLLFIIVLLVLVVMVQNPKGGGLSSSFGGGGQQLGGVQKTSDFLDRSTWVLAGLLIALILLSNIALDTNNTVTDSKLLEDTTTPVIPETLPESTPDTSQETIPEIPEVPVDNN